VVQLDGWVEMNIESDGEAPVDTAEPYVRKATALARELHHQRVHVAHLLLAISLTRSGTNLFDQHKLVVKDVRESCWRQLEKEPFTLEPPVDATPSDELNLLLRHAASFSNGGTLQIDHLLRAITDVKLLGKFASLIQKAPQPGDTHEVVSRIVKRLDIELPEINRRLGLIENSQGVAISNIDALQGNVGTGSSDGNLHTAADRLKKRMTIVKSWVIGAAATIMAALVVHIILTR